jgi:hypothetical protein
MKSHANANPAILDHCASLALLDFMEDLKQLAIFANLAIAPTILTLMIRKRVIQSLVNV